MNEDEIREGMERSVEEGFVEIVGERDGEPLYRVTADGELRVEGMLDEALEIAVSAFAERADVPEWMARDLLLHHAAKMKDAG